MKIEIIKRSLWNFGVELKELSTRATPELLSKVTLAEQHEALHAYLKLRRLLDRLKEEEVKEDACKYCLCDCEESWCWCECCCGVSIVADGLEELELEEKINSEAK